MRPKASISASAGPQYAATSRFPSRPQQPKHRPAALDLRFQDTTGHPRGATLNMSQTLFDGGRTEDSVRQAESDVFAGRASLCASTEQAILQNGATAYMNVLRDTAMVCCAKTTSRCSRNSSSRRRDRFQIGEVTRTDVSQSEASLAQARSEFYAAQASLEDSVANYRQIIGAGAEAAGAGARRSRSFCRNRWTRRSRSHSSSIRMSIARGIRWMRRRRR